MDTLVTLSAIAAIDVAYVLLPRRTERLRGIQKAQRGNMPLKTASQPGSRWTPLTPR